MFWPHSIIFWKDQWWARLIYFWHLFFDTHILDSPKNVFSIHMTASFDNLHHHLRSSITLHTFKLALSKHLFSLNWVWFPWFYFYCFLFWFVCTSGRTSSDDGCCNNKSVYVYIYIYLFTLPWLAIAGDLIEWCYPFSTNYLAKVCP